VCREKRDFSGRSRSAPGTLASFNHSPFLAGVRIDVTNADLRVGDARAEKGIMAAADGALHQVRVDLALLNGQGRLARTYGGAMAMGAHPEASLRQRTGEAFEQKHAIARWAAAVIVPGESILLDAGSTVGALAHELRGFDRLSVTTPGINTMQELAESEGIEVDCLGGRLRSVSQSFVGPPWQRRRWSG
jgi:hypothetical protein